MRGPHLSHSLRWRVRIFISYRHLFYLSYMYLSFVEIGLEVVIVVQFIINYFGENLYS